MNCQKTDACAPRLSDVVTGKSLGVGDGFGTRGVHKCCCSTLIGVSPKAETASQ